MANTVNLEFAGDADKLAKEARRAEQSVAGVGDASLAANRDMERAADSSNRMGDRMSNLANVTSGAMDVTDGMAASTQALADIQDAGRQKAQRLAQAANDVAQAHEDMAQSTRDAAQAQIDSTQAALDLEQAQLDQATALKDYNAAVKEYGANSDEARQAQIDLKQAGIDVTQAQEDQAQALRDGSQAAIDAKQAQIDLNDAQAAANPPDMQQWADQINMYAPLLNGLVGIFALVTAAQWAWNAAQLASPITWIIVGIVALVAAIVLLVKNWDWVKEKGGQAWGWMRKQGEAFWNWLKKVPGWVRSTFSSVASFLMAPFKAAFNGIARLWNSTIGSLSFSIPGWVPGIGGQGFAVPDIPTFHQGGTVPGAPGQEVLTRLQAGETVTSMAGSVGGQGEEWIRLDMGELGEALLDPIARAVGRRGGSAVALGVKVA